MCAEVSTEEGFSVLLRGASPLEMKLINKFCAATGIPSNVTTNKHNIDTSNKSGSGLEEQNDDGEVSNGGDDDSNSNTSLEVQVGE